MNKKNTAASLVPFLAAVLIFTTTMFFSGCSDSANARSETVPESFFVTETETASPYLLVRGWEGRELLDSLFLCGKKRPLPFALEDEPDLIFSDGMLIFPDGSYAEAAVRVDNSDNSETKRTIITALRFRRESAPADFSLTELISVRRQTIYPTLSASPTAFTETKKRLLPTAFSRAA